MKKTLLVFILTISTCYTYSQVKIVAPAERKYTAVKYDSLVNFAGENVNLYIGQDLFVVPKPHIEKYGYSDFYTSTDKKALVYGYDKIPKRDSTEYEKKYKFRSNFEPAITSTPYDLLAGKTLKVIGVCKRPIRLGEDIPTFISNSEVICYLKLLNGLDTLYYKYDSSEASFPFLITGYVEKLKQLNIGKLFYMRKHIAEDAWNDFTTGLPVKLVPESIWKCTDVVLDGQYMQFMMLVFQNSKGETITTEECRVKFSFISKRKGDQLRQKYNGLYSKAMNGISTYDMPVALKTIATGEAYE